MDRRAFLATGALGAAALAVAPDARAALPAAAPPAGPTPAPPPFEFDEVTVDALQQAMAGGRHTARSIAEAYLARIEAVDRPGDGRPGLRAVVEINPDALADAARLDAERRAGRVRGPLHGIPVLLKDNIDTADRMQTTAGSLALVGAPAPQRDAFLAARLRAAGAVLLGKTNLSEWANFRSTRSSSGWSGRGGQTRNPYALDRTPCGSSSGSGAAVAANLAAIAVGTETDGSIVCPSATCGLVGVKPTLGLVSRSGVIPIAHSQDTAGPMARTVRDAAVLLGALASGGADPRDPATAAAQRAVAADKGMIDYVRYLVPGALRGARVGVARHFFGFHADVDRVMAEALRALRDAGAVIVDPAPVPNTGKYDATENAVLQFEFKADLNAYLAQRFGRGAAAPNGMGEPTPRTLADLIAFNERHRDREMPYFGQEIFVQSEARGPLTTPAYQQALAANRRLAGAQGIDAALAAHRLDVLVAPTNGPAWTIDVVTGDHFSGGYASPSAVAGYPHVTVPAGVVQGLPIGLSFFGARFAEPRLLGYAYGYEQATRLRRAPDFRASVAV